MPLKLFRQLFPSVTFALIATTLVLGTPRCATAQVLSTERYAIGNPQLIDIWVDPTAGNDSRTGASREQALRSVSAAWQKVPRGQVLQTGYRILLAAGFYPRASLPNYWEERYGSYSSPVILQSIDGPGRAVFQGDINAFDLRYFYLIDFNINPVPAGDAFHCERCSHVLLRGMDLSGGAREAQETIKVNQSEHLYLEDSSIHGASDNAIDFVAVQYGHIIGNKISDAGDWCAYVKGGSAQLVVAENEIFNCQTGGFTAGQGTGLEFMTAPWVHYEAYDVKVINNIIHDTTGAGFGVNGGFNVLIAHNTLYRVGSASHAIEVVYGLRSCDGATSSCAERLQAGAWGTTQAGFEESIPNKNIFIYNNLLYNPPGFESRYAHFSIQGPRQTAPGSNLSPTIVTDSNLQIRGNMIWNGPAELSLGIEESNQGCQPSNPTCSAIQLRRDNSINELQPQLVAVALGNVRPVLGGSVYRAPGFQIPNFGGTDYPTQPQAPPGIFTNSVSHDFAGAVRNSVVPVGAFAGPLRPAVPAAGYLLWNSFLSMTNIAELVNRGAEPTTVVLTVHDVDGRGVSQLAVVVPARGQQDVILNDLSGFPVNSYGLVTLDFSGQSLDARLSFYRSGQAGTFEFAYASALVAPSRGTTAVSFNTMQPSRNVGESALPVSNWLSISNSSPTATRSFTVRQYDQAGALLGTRRVTVAPFGRTDLEAGHLSPGPGTVGLHQIVPDDPSSEYFAHLVRYGAASPTSGATDGYAFAYPLQTSPGAATPVHTAISTGGGAQNWVEVVNASNEPLDAIATFYGSNGETLRAPLPLRLAAHSQIHLDAASLLGPSASGLLTISASRPGALIAHSLFYYYRPDGTIAAMYGSRAEAVTDGELSGSYNLYLGMANWLKVSNTSNQTRNLRLRVFQIGGQFQELRYVLPAHATVELPLHETQAFGTAVDSYGQFELFGNDLIAELLRVRSDISGFDFVFPTRVR